MAPSSIAPAPRRAGLSRRDLFALKSRAPRPAAAFDLRLHRAAMACRFEIVLPGEDAAALGKARLALDEAHRVESRLSVFQSASEVSRVNDRAALSPVVVDDELFALLVRCRELTDATGGAFDITATPLSVCWGFLNRAGRLPESEALDAARARVGMHRIALEPTARTVAFSVPGMALNFGSIGKGFAVQQIGRRLRAQGIRDALVSAGGSSALALGQRDAGWEVDLRPRAFEGPPVRLHLRDCAMATSGAGEQFVEIDGTRYGHVIDPRSGRPASGTLSATVVANDAATADALATAFLVGGVALARGYCRAHADTLAILVPDDDSRRPCVIGTQGGARVEVS